LPTATIFLDLVAVHGPWLLFLLAFLETCFITGLVVPSGLATLVATAVALEEGVSVVPVAAAAIAGGAIGDSVGFWIGRKGRQRWADGPGRMAERVRGVLADATRIFGRHPLISVTLARLISFVRTVMPMAAGTSHLPYPRYLPYELAGVAIWCILYMLMGAAAEEGWDVAARAFGVGGALLLVALLVVLGWIARERVRAGARSV